MTYQLPHGVYAALITPLDESGRPDPEAVSRLVGRSIAFGVAVICTVGSAGEGPLLGHVRRARVVDLVCHHAGGRVPVVPTVSETDMPSVLTELRHFADLGATAALVTAPPFYRWEPDQLIRFFSEVASNSPLPIMLYDIPAFVGVAIGPTVCAQLAAHDKIIGVKDSTGDETNLNEALAMTRDQEFGVYCGAEQLFATAGAKGAAGVIGGSANVAPQLVRDLWHAAVDGIPKAVDLQTRLTALADACRTVGRPWGWKAAAAELGLCRLEYCAPLAQPDAELLRQLHVALEALGLSPVGDQQ